jgi:hypothetical protein
MAIALRRPPKDCIYYPAGDYKVICREGTIPTGAASIAHTRSERNRIDWGYRRLKCYTGQNEVRNIPLCQQPNYNDTARNDCCSHEATTFWTFAKPGDPNDGGKDNRCFAQRRHNADWS